MDDSTCMYLLRSSGDLEETLKPTLSTIITDHNFNSQETRQNPLKALVSLAGIMQMKGRDNLVVFMR